MKEIQVRNAQRARRINNDLLRRIAVWTVEDQLGVTGYQIALQIVSARKMAAINWDFLRHEGSTDVITFDYREGYERTQEALDLSGEVYICIDDALRQASEFNTTWQEEIVRYVIHGILHLQGYNDLASAERRVMKRQEERFLERARSKFQLEKLGSS